MLNNSNERLEREARESLVAADLSAKMKQWRNSDPPPEKGKGWLLPVLLLLAFGGAAWLFWPQDPKIAPPTQEAPTQPMVPDQNTPTKQEPSPELPIAQKPAPGTNRYLALAQSNYRAPNFANDIRGEAANGFQALDLARQALAANRFSEALKALQEVPSEYQVDAAYLRGHALFGQKKYPQAAAIFGQLSGSVRYGDDAQWYEVISLLPDFEQNKALIYKKLNKISDDSGHPFQSEADRLLGQL